MSEYVQGNPVEYDINDNSIIISDETIDGLIKKRKFYQIVNKNPDILNYIKSANNKKSDIIQ